MKLGDKLFEPEEERIKIVSGPKKVAKPNMTVENSLLKEIKSRPYEVEPWLVYCDWLEANGSNRADLIRELLQGRLPPTAMELEKYKPRAIAANKPPSENDFDFAKIPKEYQTDVDAIGQVKIFRNFPRDLDGRLPLKRRAVLSYTGNDPWSFSKQPCLIVRSPVRRRDPQCLTVAIEDIIVRNQAYNWAEARWLWDRHTDPPKSPMKPNDALFKNAAKTVQQLKTRSNPTEKQRQQLGTHLLDLGLHKQAFELFGIRWDDSLDRITCKMPRVVENPMVEKGDYPIKKGNAQQQLKRLLASSKFKLDLNDTIGFREQIWFAAPWKIKPLIDQVYESRKSTMKTKRKCHLRLFAFPKQTGQSKRAVFVGCDKQGKNHSLYIETTQSNDRLALVSWQREFWFDMQRLGMSEN